MIRVKGLTKHCTSPSQPTTQYTRSQNTLSPSSRHVSTHPSAKQVFIISILAIAIFTSPTLAADAHTLHTTSIPVPPFAEPYCPIGPLKPLHSQQTLDTYTFFGSVHNGKCQEISRESHPADHAICAHDKIDAHLKDASPWNSYGYNDKNCQNLAELQVQEAVACENAADLMGTPHEQLEWLLRGICELDLPLKGRDYSSYSYNSGRGCDLTQTCNTGVSLWEKAASTFLKLPANAPLDFFIFRFKTSYRGIYGDVPITPEGASARCLLNAAQAQEFKTYKLFEQNNYQLPTSCEQAQQEAINLYVRSYETLKKINLSSLSLHEQVDIQEETVHAVSRAFNSQKKHDLITKQKNLDKQRLYAAKVGEESKVATKLYDQLIKKPGSKNPTYFKIKKADSLARTGTFSPTLEQIVQYYTEAYHTALEAWNADQKYCERSSLFVLYEDPEAPNPERTVIDDYKISMDYFQGLLEKEQAEKNNPSNTSYYQSCLSNIWDYFTKW